MLNTPAIKPGSVYGRLTVLRRIDELQWLCQCECGKQKAIYRMNLRRGASRSCGCLSSEMTAARSYKHGAAKRGKLTPEYRIWRGMKTRCTNPNEISYRYYGQRGVTICKRWRSFNAFLADMGPRPSKKYSIERIDNEGPYSPENCKWALPLEQGCNKRNNHLLSHAGLTLTLSQWSRHVGLKPGTLYARITKQHWPPSRALQPLNRPTK